MTTVNGTSSSTGTTGTTPTPPSTSTSATGSTQLDSNTFLKLLVAQLKYQDPSSPSDATQFLSETAQFSVVQKLDALSALDQKVLDASKAQTAAALIGKQVTYTDVAGKSHTGTVTGTTLGQEIPNVTVDGQVVSLDALSAVGTVASPDGGSSSS
jgi:flagellar basal-body rod modification protein FlgD